MRWCLPVGIGEHDAASRQEIAQGLAGLGVAIDAAANRLEHVESGLGVGRNVRRISEVNSRVAVYVVPAEEDMVIARHVAEMCGVSLPSERESQ